MQQVKKKYRKKSSKELARLCAQAAIDKKAENPVILDVRKLCSFADFFVIMSGRSTRHVQGLAEAIERQSRSICGARNFRSPVQRVSMREHGFCLIIVMLWYISFTLRQEGSSILRGFGMMHPEFPWMIRLRLYNENSNTHITGYP
jgi:hypothetical protein